MGTPVGTPASLAGLTPSTRALLHEGFAQLGVQRVTAIASRENPASRWVTEEVDMRQA